jgi:hypothetical protein
MKLAVDFWSIIFRLEVEVRSETDMVQVVSANSRKFEIVVEFLSG